jgi:CheY-like chemotaxis protein
MRPSVLLYVEDEKGDVFFMRHAFENLGVPATLQIASTGPQAIAYLAGTDIFSDRTIYPLPTVVLLDINLPGCSGFDVLKWLREQPEYMHLPVIMFSSSIRPEDLQKARVLGATDYIEKPGSGLDFSLVAEQLWRNWMSDNPAPSSSARSANNSGS